MITNDVSDHSYSKAATELDDRAAVKTAQVEVEGSVFDVISSRILDDFDDLSQHVAVAGQREAPL